MAELAIKIKDTGNYKDGQIIDAFNDERIHRVSPQLSKWPATQQEKKEFLWITVDDFSNEKLKELKAVDMDAEGVVVTKRKCSVNWRALKLAFTKSEIEDHGKESDCREANFKLADILISS